MLIERIWAMPFKWTFVIRPIKKLLKEEIQGGLWADPFCGRYSPAQIKNDLNPEMTSAKTSDSADFIYHMDALEFLKLHKDESFDGVLFDPPYSITQAAQCYKSFGKEKLKVSVSSMQYWASVKNEIARIIKPGGKAICFGWTSMGLGINRGFEIIRILLVPHGGSKNDTICTVEIKK